MIYDLLCDTINFIRLGHSMSIKLNAFLGLLHHDILNTEVTAAS